jgi:hypothetical protein
MNLIMINTARLGLYKASENQARREGSRLSHAGRSFIACRRLCGPDHTPPVELFGYPSERGSQKDARCHTPLEEGPAD